MVHGSGRRQVVGGWSVLHLRTIPGATPRGARHSQSHRCLSPYDIGRRSYYDRGRSANQHPGKLLCQRIPVSQFFEQCHLFNGGSGYPIDTSAAGPSGTGGNVAIVGGPSTNQLCGANYIMNNTTHRCGRALRRSLPILLPAFPRQPSRPERPEAVTPVATVAQGYTPTSDATYGYIYGTWVASGTDSCPNTAAQQHYLPTALLPL